MVQYKKFKVDSLFDIQKVRGINKSGLTQPSNGECYDYITRTSKNNGIESHTGLVESRELNEASTFSLGLLQMTFFYRDKPWYAGQFVRKIVPKRPMTKEQLLYFLGIFQALRPLLSSVLVRKIDETFSNAKIELPVTPAGEPDFKYMTMRIRELEAERIRELEAERIRELEAYLHVTGLDDTTLSASEAQALTQKVQWKKFKINNFFKVLPVKHKLIKRELSSCGQYPCYSSDTSNYGILGYTNNPEFHIDDKHSYLIFGDHTRSMRIAESDFSVLDNVKVLCGQKLSKEKLLFVEAMWHKAIPNLGYARHWSVAKNVDFLLPVTSTGDVDFDYMQNYIRATEKQTIKGVVEYKDRVIKETKKVVGE